LKAVRDFRRFAGGFAANVATGLARLGVDVAIVSAVGEDGNGSFIREFLETAKVDTRWMTTDSEWLTPLSFCELWPPDHFPLTYYRQPTAPDWEMPVDERMIEEAHAADLLVVSGTGLARPKSHELTMRAMRACPAPTVLDLDYRAALWPSDAAYARTVAAAAIDADIMVGNESEVAASGLTPEALVAEGKTLILKRGAAGVSGYAPGEEVHVAGTPTNVVNGLGSGDAFAAALGYGLLNRDALQPTLARASLAGAIVAGRLACADAMPTLEELAESALEATTSGDRTPA
jgi:5-dehydro-2-deoxygluconokinase